MKKFWIIRYWDWYYSARNHDYPFWPALHRTLLASFWDPIKAFYSWLWIKTYWKWDLYQLRKLRREIESGNFDSRYLRRLRKKHGRM